MPIYIKFDGIDGEVTEQNHVKWIEVLSFSWGVTNQSTIGSGSGGTSAGKASFQDFHFVQKTQSSSPLLLDAAARGKLQASAMLSFLKFESNPTEYLKIKLEDVLISGFQTAGAEGSEGDVPTDQVSLNFAKISYDYLPPSSDTGSFISFVFDVRQAA